jgi:peptidoglycan/xylan/chitin deacetylase (PgdA/CDA1 family)
MLERELILNFHGLGDETPPDATAAERKVWVPVDWFEAIVGALPARGVTLTFDDGNSSDAEHALGVLKRKGHRARFFVLAERVGSPGYLTESQIGELHEAGMKIGSHGLRHRDWRGLSDAELQEELVDSRRTLEKLLGVEVDEAACPFGSYDRRVLHGLREAGYRKVYNSDGGSARVGAWLAPRNTVHRELELERWLALAASGAGGALQLQSPMLAGKRLVKRLR